MILKMFQYMAIDPGHNNNYLLLFAYLYSLEMSCASETGNYAMKSTNVLIRLATAI